LFKYKFRKSKRGKEKHACRGPFYKSGFAFGLNHNNGDTDKGKRQQRKSPTKRDKERGSRRFAGYAGVPNKSKQEEESRDKKQYCAYNTPDIRVDVLEGVSQREPTISFFSLCHVSPAAVNLMYANYCIVPLLADFVDYIIKAHFSLDGEKRSNGKHLNQ
jgi:hypothetical protein